MRLVTWNCCRGPFSKKVHLLDTFAPNIAVIQECAKPPVESDTCLWFGDNPRQGIAVKSSDGYRLRALPTVKDVPKFVFPVEVMGAESFLLLVVWSKGKQPFRYVMGVVKAVEAYRHLIERSQTVLVGDLNSNAIWDSWHPPHLNHTALTTLLYDLGLVSSYHTFFDEAHGAETRPTCFLLWKETRPYHIDYCFVPKAWIPRMQRVEVGSYATWKEHSDHRPLLVEIADTCSAFLPRGGLCGDQPA